MKHISDVDTYIERAPKEQQSLLRKLRNLIDQAVTKAEEQVKWKQPVYAFQGKDFASIKSTDSHIQLEFLDFDHLEDPQGLLKGTGNRMRHVRIESEEDIDDVVLTGMLQQAAGHA